MKTKKFGSVRAGIAAALFAVAFGLPAAVYAVVDIGDPTERTFYFSGNCTDCAEQADQDIFVVGGSLTLNIYEGFTSVELDNSNFVSFIYDGSNLIPDGYTVRPEDLIRFSANLDISTDPLTVFDNLYLSFGRDVDNGATEDREDWEFELSSNGDWHTGQVAQNAQDEGNSGCLYQQNSCTASGVPAPGVLALLGIGLLGLGARRRAGAAAPTHAA